MKKFITCLLTAVFLLGILGNLAIPGAAEEGADDRNFLKKPIPDKTVVLTFDDALYNHYKNVVPELFERGFGATFYVSELSFEAYGTKNYADGVNKGVYMTWEQIAEVASLGFEIGNHSMTHSNLLNMSKAGVTREVTQLEQKCAEYGIEKPVTFAYPGLPYSDTIIEVLEENGYWFGRSGIGMTYNPQKESPFRIMADDGTFNFIEFMEKADRAKDGEVVVFLYHDVPDRTFFASTMDYLEKNDFNVLSLKDLAEYIDIEKANQYFKDHPDALMVPKYSSNQTSFSYPGDFGNVQGDNGFFYMYAGEDGTPKYCENVGGYMWVANNTDEKFCRISADIMHLGTKAHPILRWEAPWDGIYTIKGNVKKQDRIAADSHFTITGPDEVLAEQEITNNNPMTVNISEVVLKKGDSIWFSLSCETGTGGANEVQLTIKYRGEVEEEPYEEPGEKTSGSDHASPDTSAENPSTSPEEKKKGCKSMITSGSMLALMASFGAGLTVCARKRKKK